MESAPLPSRPSSALHKPSPRVRDPNAFDFLRLAASLAVLYSHSFALFGLPEPIAFAGLSFGSLGVSTFFAVSGFLVCQSWRHDPSLPHFALRRGLRIFPGLLSTTVFTVFVVGAACTTLPLGTYLGHPDVWRSVRDTLFLAGEPHLPQVFGSNPYPDVSNGSLWTLRYEVLMYAILAGGGALLPARRFAGACLVLCAGFALLWTAQRFGWPPLSRLPLLWRLDGVLAMAPLYYGAFFFAGCCLNFCFGSLALSHWAALGLLGVCALSPAPFSTAFLLLALPYAALVFAYRAPAPLKRLKVDYSYGIYIYAFPIQQVICGMASKAGWSWLATLLMSVAATLAMAAMSWHWVERPVLELKSRLVRSAKPVPTGSAGSNPPNQ